MVFIVMVVVTDGAVYFLADRDAKVSLQLAGISTIDGAVWEAGRLAAKTPTQEEYDRDVMLYRKFDEFESKRLAQKGSCNRSEVISAFRRYNPKMLRKYR